MFEFFWVWFELTGFCWCFCLGFVGELGSFSLIGIYIYICLGYGMDSDDFILNTGITMYFHIFMLGGEL